MSVSIGGYGYYHHRHWWYRRYWHDDDVYYYPVYPPAGYYYPSLPPGYTTETVGGDTYYVSNDVYYVQGEKDGKKGYVVAEAPKEKAPAKPEVTGDPDAPDPFKTLQAACDYLKGLKDFKMIASDTSDEMLDSGEKIKLHSRRTVYVRRPDKAAVEFRGDKDNRRVVYDGQTVTMLSRTRKAYGVIKVPNTIQGMLNTVATDYGMSLPLGDLIDPDAYKILAGQTESGQYIGTSVVGVYECHHLAFTQETVDWEIWVQTGKAPFPRRLVITYKQLPGSPRYVAIIPTWKAELPEAVFKMSIPGGTRKIEILPLKAE